MNPSLHEMLEVIMENKDRIYASLEDPDHARKFLENFPDHVLEIRHNTTRELVNWRDIPDSVITLVAQYVFTDFYRTQCMH